MSVFGIRPDTGYKKGRISGASILFNDLKAGLWIRIHLNPDPDSDPAFFVNPDPEPNQIRIRIQTESGSESRTGSKPDPG
jgi:hypothetical protein